MEPIPTKAGKYFKRKHTFIDATQNHALLDYLRGINSIAVTESSNIGSNLPINVYAPLMKPPANEQVIVYDPTKAVDDTLSHEILHTPDFIGYEEALKSGYAGPGMWPGFGPDSHFSIQMPGESQESAVIRMLKKYKDSYK